MFREITRIKQKITDEECREILRRETRGVLALNGDDGYPIALPMNHYYDEGSDTIYFHAGKVGYKLDCIRRSDKACFTVTEAGARLADEWWLTVRSVVVQGKVEIISDDETIRSVAEKLSRKFTNDNDYIAQEIEKYVPATLLLALHAEHICGKRVKEK